MSEPKLVYDLLVIGSGPAGQRAALEAAKLRKRVALVERRAVVGGVCINTGTIPSKTLREAVLYLSGYHQRPLYGEAYAVKREITMADLFRHTQHVIRKETEFVEAQLHRAHVELLHGAARFVDEQTVEIVAPDSQRLLRAARIVIAVGTRPSRPETVCFQAQRIIDSDEILELEDVPRRLVVVGAGVIGSEYATIFASLGSQVTLVDQRPRLLDFVDDEIAEAMQYHFRSQGGVLRLGESVESVACPLTAADPVVAQLASGKRLVSDCLLYAAGRVGATADLGLERVGIVADARGRLAVDEHYRTATPGIYAVGDVIGFPSLASTSMEQGRRAALHAFGQPSPPVSALFPLGIYTIPEISMVGQTEAALTAAAVPYVVGIARYREIARGVILGDETGMLKLIVGCEDRRLLGVHTLGQGAAELIHLGQAVIALGGTVDFFIESVFNYPTLAEAYKVAAERAVDQLQLVIPALP